MAYVIDDIGQEIHCTMEIRIEVYVLHEFSERTSAIVCAEPVKNVEENYQKSSDQLDYNDMRTTSTLVNVLILLLGTLLEFRICAVRVYDKVHELASRRLPAFIHPPAWEGCILLAQSA